MLLTAGRGDAPGVGQTVELVRHRTLVWKQMRYDNSKDHEVTIERYKKKCRSTNLP